MNYDWLEKKSPRSVDHLRLWPENPRLDPEEKHVRIYDYASDLVEDLSEKNSFISLIKSIAKNGFIPSDPIVVWKNKENKKFYVAEGNRRILALKLLRNPDKAPKSIRASIRKAATSINSSDIAKVRVAIAPSFEACEWYINQRHASSSHQRPWSRLQQQRWIAELYEKYNKNIDRILTVTNLTKSDIDSTLRILKIRDLALQDKVISQLNEDERDKVKSHHIPMTILERWFSNTKVKEKWGLAYSEDKVTFRANINIDSFYNAYAALIKLIIHRKDPDIPTRVDTRTIDPNVDNILTTLPQISFIDDTTNSNKPNNIDVDDLLSRNETSPQAAQEDEKLNTQEQTQSTKPVTKYNDLNRNKLIIKSGELITSNTKLEALYNELKEMPVTKYPTCIAIALRVFLDIAVAEYFKAEDAITGIEAEDSGKKFKDISLSSRLEFLKKRNLKKKTDALKVVQKLLNHTNEHSLDTLNSYIHSDKTDKLRRDFLNSFWDFLFPLFNEILDIQQ